MFYDIKEIKYVLKGKGSTLRSSYQGSIGFKRPQSQFEAEKMALEWLKKKYPNYEVEDLTVTIK